MSPTGGHTENILLIVLIQLTVIIAASRMFGGLFRRIGQPLVCGETWEVTGCSIHWPRASGSMFR